MSGGARTKTKTAQNKTKTDETEHHVTFGDGRAKSDVAPLLIFIAECQGLLPKPTASEQARSGVALVLAFPTNDPMS